MADHYIKNCKYCKKLMGQCRCIGPKTQRWGICDDCMPKEILQQHKREEWYCWKERAYDESGDPRLLTPWSDPKQYEFEMDWLFKTPEEARASKKEHAEDEDWVLCKVILEVVEEA